MGMGVRFTFGVFIKAIEGEFGITRGATSGIFSLYMLVCFVFSILGGWALDKYGPRKISFLMGLFTGLSLLTTSMTHSPWQFYLTYSLLLAFGTGPLYTVVNSTSSRWFHKKRGLAVGITTSGGGLGIILFAPFATYLISHLDWRKAFIVLGIMCWAVMSSMALLMRKDPGEIGLLPDGEKQGSAPSHDPEGGSKVQTTGYSLRQGFKMSNFWVLWLIWLLVSLTLHMVLVHVVPYTIEAGISPMNAAFVLSLMGFSNPPGRLVVGRVSDIIGRKQLAVACALIQVGSLLWLMGSGSLWAFYCFGIAFGLMWGGYSTMTTALVGDVFGMRHLGIIMGVMSGGWALGAAIGPAIGGAIFDAWGNYFAAFASGAGAILISAILVALMRKY